MICKGCNHIRDVDLCRDPYIVQTGTECGIWSCIHCKTEYDLDEIEQNLVDAVKRKSMAYILQDIKCTRCKEVNDRNLAKHCRCAGSFATTLSPEDFQQTLNIFKNIAKFYNLPLLFETISWVTQPFK